MKGNLYDNLSLCLFMILMMIGTIINCIKENDILYGSGLICVTLLFIEGQRRLVNRDDEDE